MKCTYSKVWKLFSHSSNDVSALLPYAMLLRKESGTHKKAYKTYSTVHFVSHYFQLTLCGRRFCMEKIRHSSFDSQRSARRIARMRRRTYCCRDLPLSGRCRYCLCLWRLQLCCCMQILACNSSWLASLICRFTGFHKKTFSQVLWMALPVKFSGVKFNRRLEDPLNNPSKCQPRERPCTNFFPFTLDGKSKQSFWIGNHLRGTFKSKMGSFIQYKKPLSLDCSMDGSMDCSVDHPNVYWIRAQSPNRQGIRA